MAVHTFFLFPETAGKTLEDVEEMFMTGVPAWKTKVEYSSTRRAERGEIDNEKAAGLEHSPVRVENAETKA
ncbi:High-affinity glucose transporter [Alternaria alternata]|jgi:uncharacterized lipoprotein YehR (DUF1307 family)|nr:High-affinity glucose transporter [Alternaria alternata]